MVYGNLLTLPVGDGLLYVQPLYAQRKTGAALYPALRYVLVSFGEQVGIGTTLTAALDDVLGIASSPTEGTGGTTGGSSGGSGGTSGGSTVPGDVRSLLQQAEAQFAAAQRALQSGDLEGYAKAQGAARDLVRKALVEAGKASPSGKPSPSSSASPSASPSS